MMAVVWMAGVSAVSWLVVSTVGGEAVNPEALWGMAGPLAVATVSWMVYERVHGGAPERLTSAMVAALVVKMVFFGGYVIVLVRLVGLRPEPFVVSFAAYFIALHAMEAWFLRRLLVSGMYASGDGRA